MPQFFGEVQLVKAPQFLGEVKPDGSDPVQLSPPTRSKKPRSITDSAGGLSWTGSLPSGFTENRVPWSLESNPANRIREPSGEYPYPLSKPPGGVAVTRTGSPASDERTV